MSGQFIVGTVFFMLAVGFTANLWLKALQQVEFRKIANFYRVGFMGLTICLAALIWAQAFAAIGTQIGNALLQGLTAVFVVFVIFGWARLTALGLKFDLTHISLAE